MVERSDVRNLLQTGSWRTSRSRSPSHYEDYQYSQMSQSSRSDVRPSRSSGRPRRVYWPPPPSVEDEVESLSREHTPSIAPSFSDDEPKHRGDIDQLPILVPVQEHNPERRFVLVTSSDADDDDVGDTAYQDHTRSQSPTKSEYDENTCRQYVLVSPNDDHRDPPRKPQLGKRRSHQELPPLETDFRREEPPIKRSNSRRNREKAVVDQPSRESARPIDDTYLSPVVHTAGGRDRVYLEINPGNRSPSGRGHSRENSRSSRNDEGRYSQSASSPTLRRRVSSASGNRPAINPMDGYGRGNPDAVIAFMDPGGETPRRTRASESPTKTRKGDSPPYPEQSWERPSSRPAGQRSRRESSAREQGEYYGVDSLRGSRSNKSERPRAQRTGTEPDSLLSPERSRPIPIGRPKGPSPLPSPRIAQSAQFPEPSSLPIPRSPLMAPMPYPTERGGDDEYSSSLPTAAGASPPRMAEDGGWGPRPQGPSRSASILDGVAPKSFPVVVPSGRGNPTDRRAPPSTREDSQDPGSPGAYRQPGPADSEKQRAYFDRPITTFRRYSEDVAKGTLPQFPECRWKTPQSAASGVQFLSLPRAGNFLICPDCYGGVLARNEEFKRFFVPAPARPPDQGVFCHFGSSLWYYIAFFMTIKYRYPDLRLLESVASVATRQPPCLGFQSASRVWQSMIDPSSKTPIRSFHVCPSCAGMVSALLPNLSGMFVPLESSNTPSRSWCELYYAPDRQRFFEYFDLMENTHDRASNRRSTSDLQDLADHVRDISLVDECPRNAPVQNGKWHVMADLREFTVCEECYDAIVWPLIEDDRKKSEVAANFIRKRQAVPIASCQLYSKRMRDAFRRACRRNDIGYLKEKLAQESS